MAKNIFFTPETTIKIEEILKLTESRLLDNDEKILKQEIKGVSNLIDATKDDISFFENKKYTSHLKETNAAFCFVTEADIKRMPDHLVSVITKNPYRSFIKILDYLYKEPEKNSSISEKATIAKSAVIGDNCQIEENVIIRENVKIGAGSFIGAGSYISKNVQIGNNCKIHQNVIISNSVIGNDVTIKPHSTLGQRGFGFYTEDKKSKEIKHIGSVEIGNNVEIGTFACIDRSSFGKTVIGNNTKLDSKVHMGHNVVIGDNCFIGSGAGFAGSCKLGNNILFGPRAGVNNHVSIGNNCIIYGYSVVLKTVADNSKLAALIPAIDFRVWKGFLKKFFIQIKKDS